MTAWVLSAWFAAAWPGPVADTFLGEHCTECHEGASAKGGLDLTAAAKDLDDARTFAVWAKVHDRVRDGEMPPHSREVPARPEKQAFLGAVSQALTATDRARAVAEGRSTLRRLNRAEYENSLRDLLGAPWLEIKQRLPEDGEAFRFNKVGDALDVSHVQMGEYLAAADYALREVVKLPRDWPAPTTTRYYARAMRGMHVRNLPERSTFPVLGTSGQPEVRSGLAAWTVGAADPATRDREAVGIAAGTYEPIEPTFNGFVAPTSGRYKVRMSGYSIWVGSTGGEKWWRPDLDRVSPGRRPEPVTLYAERPPRQIRRLGAFDVGTTPTVREIDILLYAGETIRPDASRLFRSRPPDWRNPLAEPDGQPGVAFRWLEVEGPFRESAEGQTLLFGDLPPDTVPNDPEAAVDRLLAGFLARAYRRPVDDEDVAHFRPVVARALAAGDSFADALLAGYTAVLCSPGFLFLAEEPGPLDGDALATRLSYFLWNSPPDAKLTALGRQGDLRKPAVLRPEVERLLDDSRARRFIDAFLDYWLDLRRIDATAPDASLYPDYYLDDMLTESADLEPRLFFAELLRRNLPARSIVAANFAMLNERLAVHYRLPSVGGVTLRRVALSRGHVRGGFLTMAGVLKVTANGTTTSPVQRGLWVMERILGQPPPPPPPKVPGVEPDIRGATTIRQQLAAHRSDKACAACHAKIDPVGFALESFDVFGAWRDRYRALGEGAAVTGVGKNGQRFAFHEAAPVDPSGELPGGGTFTDVVALKRLLLRDERQLARNLTRQLVVFATGAPVRFGDRARIEAILDRAAASGYGVRTLVREIVLDEVFQSK